MNANEKQRRIYTRNALVCFACTAVCIAIDIQNFMRVGFYFNWNIGLSFALYIVLIILGIRAVKKSRELKKAE